MDFIFDKDNLISLLSNSQKDGFETCMLILKEQGSICTTFPKPVIKDFTDEEDDFILLLNRWLTTMTDGCEDNIKWNEWDKKVKIERPLKSNWTKELKRESLQAVYLINDERPELILSIGGVLYSQVGQEIETIISLIFDHKQFFKCWSPLKRIGSWDALRNYCLPCTDIIIVDKYLFAEKSLYHKNIYELLKILSSKNELEINIVIFTLKEQKYKDQEKWIPIVPDFTNIRENIKKELKKVTGKNSNVTFITCSNDNFPEHDREIFTNYTYWFSGDTLCYFNSKGEFISKGRHLIVQSHALKDAKSSSDILLGDLQEHINKLKSLNNEELIIGDKISGFLSF